MSSKNLYDCTMALQERISKPALTSQDGFTLVELPKGDYAVQMIEIPGGSRIRISSKDRTRLVYAGKRNRPMFSLLENSTLSLKGKIEIFYNTNNMQEVKRLMVKLSQGTNIEISPEVKISLFSQKVE